MHKDGRILNTRENRINDSISKRKYISRLTKKTEEKIKEVRMFVVQRRDAKTLMPSLVHIIRNVNQRTEICSDEWRSYKKISKHGFKNFTVNHKKNFVDPKTKKHSQLIECLWGEAKSTILKRSRGSFKNN